MTDHTLLFLAMLCCGLASALILFRAAQNVYLRRHSVEDAQEEG